MAKNKDKMVIGEYVNFIADHPNQMIMVFNPASDEMIAAYGGKTTGLLKFKEENHVILRVVSPDMFELAIDEFMSGVIDVLDIDEQDNVQLVKTIGGSVKAIGKALEDNQKEDAKSKKRSTKKGSKGGKGRKKGGTKANR